MTQEEALKGNKLIDVFINGYERYKGDGYIVLCKYHYDWSELMKAVIKIINHKFEDGENCYLRTFGMISSDTGNVMVRFNRFQLFEEDNLFKATYQAVIQFITHYNTQEKK